MSKLTAVEPEGTWRQLPVGQQVHERYTALAKQVLQFEKQWFQGWRDNADNAAMRYLKQPIFARSPESGTHAYFSITNTGNGYTASGVWPAV